MAYAASNSSSRRVFSTTLACQSFNALNSSAARANEPCMPSGSSGRATLAALPQSRPVLCPGSWVGFCFGCRMGPIRWGAHSRSTSGALFLMGERYVFKHPCIGLASELFTTAFDSHVPSSSQSHSCSAAKGRAPSLMPRQTASPHYDHARWKNISAASGSRSASI